MYYLKKKPLFFTIILSLLSGIVFPAAASVIIDGTRVIYQGKKTEVTVTLTNKNQRPVLIQSWIDTGDEKALPEKIAVPFVLTPPINRVDAGKAQTLRISYIGTPALPASRESAFWLNVLEVPSKDKNISPDTSNLNIALRSRIKLFYRPDGLEGDPIKAAEQLHWQVHNGVISVTNSSSWYVSLIGVHLKNGGSVKNIKTAMLSPGEHQEYSTENSAVSDISAITYSVINDYGVAINYKAQK